MGLRVLRRIDMGAPDASLSRQAPPWYHRRATSNAFWIHREHRRTRPSGPNPCGCNPSVLGHDEDSDHRVSGVRFVLFACPLLEPIDAEVHLGLIPIILASVMPNFYLGDGQNAVDGLGITGRRVDEVEADDPNAKKPSLV